MPIILQCPNPACGVTSPAADAVNGRTVRCKKCGTPFTAKPTINGVTNDTKKNQPSSPTNPFPILPAEFGRYRILRLLGRGGMGAVYLALDSTLGRQVALKIPFFDASESPQRVQRFVREGRSAAALQHPNICTVYDAGEIDGRPFLTMAYIAGKSLEDEIDPDAPMPQARAAEIVRKIALALDHAHRAGTIHRDLKPANVMMKADGEPVVMDFGLAKQLSLSDANENKLTRDGGVLGTPSYMSPEQVRGESAIIGPATDIYALGVMLFEMLTGKTPYSGPLGVVMLQIQTAPVPPVKEFRPDIDARLDAVCRKAMAKAPSDRFASMADFAEALGLYLKETATVTVLLATPVAAPVAPAPSWVTNQALFAEATVTSLPLSAAENLPKGREGAKSEAATWRRPAILAGVIAAAATVLLVLWAIGVFKVKTADGILVVQVNEPNAEVFVDGDRATVSWNEGGMEAEIHVKPGARKVEVRKDGFSADGTELTFKDGDREVFTARLLPDEARLVKADAPEKSPRPDAKKPQISPADVPKPDGEAKLREVLLSHAWTYRDSLFPPGGETFRFNADGTFHVQRWKYWVVGPDTIRVHYYQNRRDKENGVLFTFNHELTAFSGEFTDPPGKVHKISGNRK